MSSLLDAAIAYTQAHEVPWPREPDAIARPHPPVRAAGDNAPLRVVAERVVGIVGVYARERGPSRHPLPHFHEP